jgi:hypothetical protein
MSWILWTSAIAALALGFMLRWYLKRGWCRYYGSTRGLAFPKICPVCLEPADVLVEESSPERVTANYVIVRQVEKFTAKIPHCRKCERKQARDVTIGLVMGILFAVIIFLLTPQPEDPRSIIGYGGFVYPFYIFSDHLHKGISFGWFNDKAVSMRIKHAGYYDQFVALNQPAPPIETPLAGGKGVWRH